MLLPPSALPCGTGSSMFLILFSLSLLANCLAGKAGTDKAVAREADCTGETALQCIFPFNFNGRIITSCTTIDGDSSAWCATATTSQGRMTEWAYCGPRHPAVTLMA